MQFNKTGYLPLNQVNTDLRKNVTKPITSFRGTESEPVKDDESQKVSAEQVKAYYGITTPYKKENTEIATSSFKEDLSDEEFEKLKAKVQEKFPIITFNKYNIQIANRLLTDENLCSNSELTDKISEKLDRVESFNEAKLLGKILSDETLYNNEKLINGIGSIFYTTTEKNVNARISILDKFSSDKNLNTNERINEEISRIIMFAESEEALDIAVKILTDENLYNNPTVKKNFAQIISNIKSKESAKVIEKILSDKKLYENTKIYKKLFPNGQTVLWSKLMNTANKYPSETVYKFLNSNEEFCDFYLNNIDTVDVFSLSSDNFLEIINGNKKTHIQMDSDGKYKVIGEETETETETDNGETKITEYKTTDGYTIRQEYSKEGTNEFQGYYESITDKDGNETITLTVPDENTPGALAIMKEVRDKDGNVTEYKQIGSVKKTGESRMITRDFESPSKVKSTQLIEETPEGRYSLFEIGDKTFERDFKITDENTTETTAWGNKYVTKFNGDSIEVTVTKKDGTSETVKLGDTQIDFNLLPLLKQQPGDFLYTLAKTGTTVGITTEKCWENNACFQKDENEIKLSEERKNDSFCFAHEFGHMLDYIVLNNLNADSELKEIFQKELDALKDKASGLNEEEIMYFINRDHKNDGGCLTEVIAETNALFSGSKRSSNYNLLRAKILQENFPETIKYIGTKIEEAMQ